jgi:holo-[acyl-carrier protein] synthase
VIGVGTGTGAVPGTVVGIGVDAVDVARLRTVMARRSGMAARLFTDGERRYADRAADPVPRMATRFAAKEAAMKALGVGIGAVRFDEVEVVRHGLDAPALVLHGSAAERARASGVERWHLSLTHTDAVAMAFVVAEGRAPEPAPAPAPAPSAPPTPTPGHPGTSA